MTKEHFFPRWLIEYAEASEEGIAWLGKEGVNPDKATIPLCKECNESFGSALEGPVAKVFRELDDGQALSDFQAELLVRWMWKFEGLQWSMFTASNGNVRYTDQHTLKSRVINSGAFKTIRRRLTLAVAFCNANDEGFRDWPLGLDTPPSENAIAMSGVFGNIAIVVSLTDFAEVIPDTFGKHNFGDEQADRHQRIFLPPCAFAKANDAIIVTKEVGHTLARLHDELGRYERQAQMQRPSLILPRRPRVELPVV